MKNNIVWSLGLSFLLFVAATPMGNEEARMYDRNIQHFSPEGQIYQVQYANQCARQGSPAIALTNGKDSIALCIERRRASYLEDFISIEKVNEIQPGAYLGFAGLSADGRRLLDKTRLFAENYKLKHGEAARIQDLAMSIADLQHVNSFVRAHRPYGVSCIVAGFDENRHGCAPIIYAIEPSSVVQEWAGICVGENAESVTKRLETHAKELNKMRVGDLGRLAARTLLDAKLVGVDEEDDDKMGQPPTSEVEVVLLTTKNGEKNLPFFHHKSRILTKRLFVKSKKEADELAQIITL